MPERPEIDLVDDDAGVRRALSYALRAAGYVVRAYGAAEDFLAEEPDLTPGVLITDVRMPGVSGIELLRRLRRMGRPWKAIVISGHGDIPMAVEAMREGASEFIEKPFEPDELLRRLDAIVEAAPAPPPARPGLLVRLTPREREVLERVASGQTTKAVALELGISPRTVEVHRAGLMRKTGARNLSELVRMAMAAGL
ncbi:MAG: response regulator transcription factor [Proteobacteria bacterium]|nr:response regulator transcription factor [Pseudomonadota bacterium]